MPTNFSGSFRDKVTLTSKQTCNWSRHFKPGSALLEVARILEMLSKNDPVNHYVFVRPKGLALLCKGKYRQGPKQGVPLNQSTVEKTLYFLESKGIVSPELSHSPSPNNPGSDFKSHLHGRVFVPHELLCISHPRECRFVGPGKTGSGNWLKYRNGQVWVPDGLAHIDDEDAAAYLITEEPNPTEERES